MVCINHTICFFSLTNNVSFYFAMNKFHFCYRNLDFVVILLVNEKKD